MTQKRTPFIILGIVGALIILGVVLATVLRDGGGDAVDGDTTAIGSKNDILASEDGDSKLGDELSLRPAGGAITNQTNLSAGSSLVDFAYDAALAPSGEASALSPELQSLLDRKIIQSTSIDIHVDEVGRYFTEIISIATTAGGFVANSTFSNVDGEQVADLTIRVPSERYQDVLNRIRGMGEVQRESSDANDITEEFTDLQARLTTLQATERRYLELLAEANGINEILLVQDRLDFVRGQIEQIQGRINLLENLTDLTTITVHLRPETAEVVVEPVPDGDGPLDAAASAWGASLDVLRGIATGILVAGAFSWWLVPPLALIAIATRWWLGRRPATLPETPA
ncbi:MAG: DUF4349 domain-containing protein [Chloroflexi bacterium]|nr:DUF4349 domain-containing protein [Chloroflexota bacterium]